MLALTLCLTVLSTAAPHRVAVVVGSNSAVEGRAALRFAHHDAEDLAEVLIHSGGFATGDVHVLLDPQPAQVLAAMKEARGQITEHSGQDMLLFYYSGHADENALYPGGQRLALDVLRAQLSDEAVSMRIGIIDACRGGSWTQAKGLSPTAPFTVGLNGLSSEGTALLASSSGIEDAHETDALSGSFFTHHLIAGLRGAADASGDGQVTLSEAFAYANRFTVRDTATRSAMTQHPSFDLRLRGRQDVVLTTIGGESTQLLVSQTAGPLEVVQLSTGITVVEGLPGEQILRLALPPGPYLVRRIDDGVVHSREVMVKAGEATRVDESALLLVGSPVMPSKGVTHATQRRFMGDVSVGLAPINPYVQGLTLNAAITWLPSRHFGWQILHGTYSVLRQTSFADQLIRDFGVLPTSVLVPGWSVDTALAWNPELFHSTASSLSVTVVAGPALVGMVDLSRHGSVAPAVMFGGSISWVFLNPGELGFDVGGVLSVRDSVALNSGTHFLNTTLGLQMAFGDGR